MKGLLFEDTKNSFWDELTFTGSFHECAIQWEGKFDAVFENKKARIFFQILQENKTILRHFYYDKKFSVFPDKNQLQTY